LSSIIKKIYSGCGLTNDLQAAVDESLHDLLQLRGARLFITGGTGYIGRWLVETLCYANDVLNLNLVMTVLTRSSAKFAKLCPHLTGNPCVSLLEGDVRTFSCSYHRYSHIIHAATDVTKPDASLGTFDVTTTGTRHVLDFAVLCNAKRFLNLSSGVVYGRQNRSAIPLAESMSGCVDVTDSNNAYALGKIASEWLGNAYSRVHGIDFSSARVFGQIGPNMPLDAHFAAGNFMRDAVRGETITVTGDGSPIRSYMYSTDLVTWLLAILVRGESGAAYNVGSDQAVSFRAFAELMVKIVCDDTGSIDVLGQTTPGMAPSFYVPDISLANKTLGLSIKVPLELAIAKTAGWYQNLPTDKSLTYHPLRPQLGYLPLNYAS
jgi:dTDP-glucose 4,6-dehydratase